MVFSGASNYNQSIKHPKKYHPCFYATDLKNIPTKTEINDASMEIRKNRFSSLCLLVGLAQIEPERAKIVHYKMYDKQMTKEFPLSCVAV